MIRAQSLTPSAEVFHSPEPAARARLAFGPDYRESVTLTDGLQVQLSTLGPEHAAELVRGYARLSERSRYHRFFSTKRSLSERDLARLLMLDGRDHYAIRAAIRTERGWEGIAVGRLARLSASPHTAELAITVLDEYQKRGLGRLLLGRIESAARERGYDRVHGEVLAENRAMLRLAHAAMPRLVARMQGPVVDIEAPLDLADRLSWPAHE
jgi:GNAT superfamily N-acetyltransferase